MVCLFQPESETKQLIKKIETWLKEIGGKVKKKEEWGKKELAYQIKKESYGIYVFWQIEAEPGKISRLSPKIKLEKDVIRYLLVKTG